MKILLASGSPRRRELLLALGHEVTAITPDVKEVTAREGLSPLELSLENARLKAHFIYQTYGLMGSDIIAGADTIVVCHNRIFGKPKNVTDAEAMLSELSDQTHQVITSYLLIGDHGQEASRSVSSDVEFRALTAKEIKAYVKILEGFDKAGGYGVQGAGAALIRKVIGSITNVIGLPIEEFLLDAFALTNNR